MPMKRAARLGALPPASWAAALIAALVGFGGTVALVVQAGQAMGGSPVQIGSAVTALCLGIAVAGAGLSLVLRMPIVLAWSTPGAALIGTSSASVGWAAATGAFAAAAALMMLLGLVPALGRLAARIPGSVASAMLAGVLLPFCLALFRTFESDAGLAALLLGLFIVGRLLFPLYAMLAVLAGAIGLVLIRGDVSGLPEAAAFGTLSGIMPAFDAGAMVSLAVPLFLVTLVPQNLPGLVVLKSAGYAPPPRPLLFFTGLASLLLAPFGAHSVNLAAITAAICTGEDAHPDRDRRWVVGLLYAGFYLLLALFSAPLVALFLAMPATTIAAITGIALINPLAGAIGGMLAAPEDRDAAILTFAATASGMALLGIGSAFWGLATGFAALGARAIAGRLRTGR
jgi:benzoate membrane transport protein